MSEDRLSAFTARRLFHYDPETGIITWKHHPDPRIVTRFVGKEAGTISVQKGSGYKSKQIHVLRRLYKYHRIAYLIMMGHFPLQSIDHINGNALDNRWANIRIATQSQNLYNKSISRNNKLGVKGVYIQSGHSRRKKYCVEVTHNGKKHYGGHHATLAEAKSARDALARRLHGEFFRS